MKKKNKKSENVIITVSSFTVTASQSSLTPLPWDRVLHLHIDPIFGAFARFGLPTRPDQNAITLEGVT